MVRTGLWIIVRAPQSANGSPYQVDSLDSRSVVHLAIRHSQPSFLPGMISQHAHHGCELTTVLWLVSVTCEHAAADFFLRDRQVDL